MPTTPRTEYGAVTGWPSSVSCAPVGLAAMLIVAVCGVMSRSTVVVAPPGSQGVSLLLARASKPEQETRIGNQTGGRVFLFLGTDDFWRDYNRMRADGIRFVREPREESYGIVCVFEDLYGNLWDLVQHT